MKSNISRSNYDENSQLAYKFAPINYQHVNLANVRRDLVCAIDYDGEWDTSNNRKNLHNFELIPVVYYNVLKTRNYYYILYCFYHADDKDHENDLEGCLLIIQRKNEKIS